MKQLPRPHGTGSVPSGTQRVAPGASDGTPAGVDDHAQAGVPSHAPGGADGGAARADATPRVARGLSADVPTSVLREGSWRLALRLAHRFRVIRTLDVAAACSPERPFKAALSAAQRTMRGLVRARLLARYRTDRFQTVYGLTQLGAQWLQERGDEGAASVRRVCDMRNPEHRLWAQFLVVCAQARGLSAWTEQELLQALAGPPEPGTGCATAVREPGTDSGRTGSEGTAQGPLRVQVGTGARTRVKFLRPDALLSQADGAVWLEVDRSARGADRAEDLRALVRGVGSRLTGGGAVPAMPLRTVVVYTRTDRIQHRVQAVLRAMTDEAADQAVVRGRRTLRTAAAGVYEVWVTQERQMPDRRTMLQEQLAGHVLVQPLPVWLPKFRLDGRGTNSAAGWMTHGALPYRRPATLPHWAPATSPLLRPLDPSPGSKAASRANIL